MKASREGQILTLFLVMGTLAAPAQGLIRFNNLSTNSGSIYYHAALLDHDVNFALYGGSADADRLELIHTWSVADASAKGILVAPGRFADPAGGVYAIAGVEPGNLAVIEVFAWCSNPTNPALAYPPQGVSEKFWNPTGPPGAEPGLVNMGTFHMTVLEPPPLLDAQLRIRAGEPGKLVVTWAVGTLMSAPTIEGPWAPITTVTNLNPTFVMSPTNPSAFFRAWWHNPLRPP